MRIAIEAQRIFRPRKHGMDIVAIELIKALQRRDTSNEYYIFVQPDSDPGVLPETPNFQIVPLKASSYPTWEQWALPRALQKIKPDLLHCTSNTAPVLSGIPLVLTLHDIIFLERKRLQGSWYQKMGNLYRRFCVPAVIRKCNFIFTVSDFEKQQIERRFPFAGERVRTIYNACGEHFSQPLDTAELEEIRKKYALPASYAFFIGNTDPKKNVKNVMRTLKILKNRNELDFKLVMPDYDRMHLQTILKEAGATDLIDHIHLTGYIHNRELPGIYRMSQFFLYPSLRESFGIPILEAMASGTPVITSDTSAMPEVGSDAALYVNPYDPLDIADGIRKLRNDECLRQSLTTKGQERVRQFSWNRSAEQVLDCYAQVGSYSFSHAV